MKLHLSLLAMLVFASPFHAGQSHASDIRNGMTMQVKAGSIWFEDGAKLVQWQALNRAGDAKALAIYQTRLLKARDAWQFTKPVDVKILSVEPITHRIKVEMQTTGRLQGSVWLLDAEAVAR